MSKLLTGFMWLIVLIISLIVLLFIAGKTLQYSHHMTTLDDLLHHYKIGIMVWRYSFMAIFIAYYPKLIRWLYRNANRPDDVLVKLSNRWIAFTICVVYEVIIVHNGFGWLVNGLIRGF